MKCAAINPETAPGADERPALRVMMRVDAALGAVARFGDGLRHVSWFVAVGQPLVDGERRDAAEYVAALGFPNVGITAAPDWHAAETVTRDRHWNVAWWEAEERTRAQLLAHAKTLNPEPMLMAALSRVTIDASDIVLGAASVAASRAGVADPALARVAAGAATQAAYQAALGLAAEAGDSHPFAIKFRLLAAGRWPLGLIGNTFHIF